MAFLDNSGDIILDAILTFEGRRRLSQGNFKITKFALGDDEIDYSLYDKNNAGGPAYYDLEILQTPIAEAGLQLNYGLIASLASDILYMPVTLINEKSLGLDNKSSVGGMFYVIDSSGDIAGANATITDGLNLASIPYVVGTGQGTLGYWLLESGLNTAAGQVPLATQANQQTYLIANQLVNKSFYVFMDSRFFGGGLGLSGGKGKGSSYFKNDGQNNSLNASISLAAAQRTTVGIGLKNYTGLRVQTAPDNVYYYGSGIDTQSNYSVLGGCRSTICAVAPIIKSGLSPEYSLYGFTNQNLDASIGFNVDYIDTTIYVVGATTGDTAQIPVRIIRRTV
tara:strand:+ start:637 stop:1650 length:1014 start_codon:yes stop_codon:yes gene_type:complete